MTVRVPALAVVVVLALASCGSSPPTPSGEAAAATAGGGSQGNRSAEVFGGLWIALEVPPSVRTGDKLMTTLRVENRYGGPVVDPGCQLSATRHALVPVDDPDAELWSVVTIDCSGPFTYEAGAASEFQGPSFAASTKYGEPLPPGNYLATVEVAGERLTYPVEVTKP